MCEFLLYLYIKLNITRPLILFHILTSFVPQYPTFAFSCPVIKKIMEVFYLTRDFDAILAQNVQPNPPSPSPKF